MPVPESLGYCIISYAFVESWHYKHYARSNDSSRAKVCHLTFSIWRVLKGLASFTSINYLNPFVHIAYFLEGHTREPFFFNGVFQALGNIVAAGRGIDDSEHIEFHGT